MNRDIYVPPEGPPQGPGPSPEIYPLMGEENIFKMLSDFYQELGQSSIRPLFPPDLEEASRKSAKFFVQVLGGPPALCYRPWSAPHEGPTHAIRNRRTSPTGLALVF